MSPPMVAQDLRIGRQHVLAHVLKKLGDPSGVLRGCRVTAIQL